MFQLFESIAIEDGLIKNLSYHEQRYRESFLKFYGLEPLKDLLSDFKIDKKFQKGLFKLRVLYNSTDKKFEILPYSFTKIKTLKIVKSEISYDLKFCDRNFINSLYNKREFYDDILIIKDGLVTDSSYANIIFYSGSEWITPKNPLLKGTKREFLLQEKIIKEVEIYQNDIWNFKSFKLVNSMRDFDKVCEYSTKNIKI